MKALRSIDARVKLICLLVYFAVALHARTIPSLGVCAGIAIASLVAARVSAIEVAKALRSVAVIVIFTAIMQVLSMQQGFVLVKAGTVAITAEALLESGRMLVGLFCVMAASVAFMRLTTADDLLRACSQMLSPLRRIGVRSDGFAFSLSVAVRFVPVIADNFLWLKRAQEVRRAEFNGNLRNRLHAYTRLFAPLVRDSFKHADVLAQASAARCFGRSGNRSSLHSATLCGRDIAFAFCAACVMLASVLL